MLTTHRLGLAALLTIAAQDGNAQCPELDVRFASPRHQGPSTLVVFDSGVGPRLFAGGGQLNLSAWNGTGWETIAGSESAFVRALLVHDFGSGPELVVAGHFIEIGGISAQRIARWNGSTWSNLGAGLGMAAGDYVYELEAFDFGSGPELVATGAFGFSGSTAVASIAHFDGSVWHPIGGGIDGDGFALTTIDFGAGAELVVGGQFQNASGVPAANIARWNGATWSALGAGTNDNVFALCAAGAAGAQTLIVGGTFFEAGGGPASLAARFDGTSWSAFPTELFAGTSSITGVSALVPDGVGFLAAGRFDSPTLPASANVARWDGAAWQPLGTGLGVVTYVGVEALARFDPQDGGGERLFASGGFSPQPGQPNAIAQWSNAAWSGLRDDEALGLTVVPGSAGAVSATMWQGELVVAGLFQAAGADATATNIARFDGTTWRSMGTSPADTYIDFPHVVRAIDLGAGPELVMGMSRYFTHDALVPLYRWNGTDWSPFLPGVLASEIQTRVQDVVTFDDGTGLQLYVCGYGLRAQPGDVADTVLRWNGSAWSRVGGGFASGLNDYVQRLFVFDDGSGPALYAGGSFPGGVRRFDGTTWSSVGAGFSGPPGNALGVSDFEVFDDGNGPRLYAGGFMHTSNGAVLNGLARWSGTAWESVPGFGPGFQGAMGLDVYDDGSGAGPRLFVMNAVDVLQAFDGTTWTMLAQTAPYFTFANVFADEALPGGGGVALLGNFQTVNEAGGVAYAQAGITMLRGCPRVASFCGGDGLDGQLAVACPCANSGASGHGCAWSASGTGTAGAHLTSSGSPVTDDLVLLADSMPAAGSSLFFQGAANPTGAVFGDGLRCASSPTVRLRTRTNQAGSAQVPNAGEPSLATIAGVVPGSGVVRGYQVWFRVAASFCTSAPFNTTNALRVHW